MKIAVLVSSTGSIFRYALQILRACGSHIDFFIISDRACGAEQIAETFSLPLLRIEETNNTRFSVKCKAYLDRIGGVDAVITFIWRLVTEELLNAYPCVNIHPALLPAFRGFGAIEKAHDMKVRFFGSTLHMVDEQADHGAVIAQIQMPLPDKITLPEMREIAFIQDVYLMLLLMDLLEKKKSEYIPAHPMKLRRICNGRIAAIHAWKTAHTLMA